MTYPMGQRVQNIRVSNEKSLSHHQSLAIQFPHRQPELLVSHLLFLNLLCKHEQLNLNSF